MKTFQNTTSGIFFRSAVSAAPFLLACFLNSGLRVSICSLGSTNSLTVVTSLSEPCGEAPSLDPEAQQPHWTGKRKQAVTTTLFQHEEGGKQTFPADDGSSAAVTRWLSTTVRICDAGWSLVSLQPVSLVLSSLMMRYRIVPHRLVLHAYTFVFVRFPG